MPLDAAPSPDERDAIGVLGGLGPYAGLDLVRALFDETLAASDQEHLPVTLISYPNRVPDRSAWIADPDRAPSPVPAMAEILRRLDEAGCVVAGIPCNTAHAPVLFDRLTGMLERENRRLRLVHIVDAIVEAIRLRAPEAHTVGVLATNSSIETRIHQIGLEDAGMTAIAPDAYIQAQVQASIFDPGWGLKARSNPPTEKARDVLLAAVHHLKERGADAVILGCTELPLAVPEPFFAGIPLINSTRALSRALIRAAHPDRLRPLADSLAAARALADALRPAPSPSVA